MPVGPHPHERVSCLITTYYLEGSCPISIGGGSAYLYLEYIRYVLEHSKRDCFVQDATGTLATAVV